MSVAGVFLIQGLEGSRFGMPTLWVLNGCADGSAVCGGWTHVERGVSEGTSKIRKCSSVMSYQEQPPVGSYKSTKASSMYKLEKSRQSARRQARLCRMISNSSVADARPS